MVEFKYDEKTDQPYLIEVNPRFIGSINESISSGVDFPYLLYKIAIDGDINPVIDYKTGVKTKNFFIDTISILQHFRNRDAIIDINPFQKINYDILSLRDPLPILKFIHLGISHTHFNF